MNERTRAYVCVKKRLRATDSDDDVWDVFQQIEGSLASLASKYGHVADKAGAVSSSLHRWSSWMLLAVMLPLMLFAYSRLVVGG